MIAAATLAYYLLLQRKMVRLITFKNRISSVEGELLMYGILSVYELYVQKLLELVLKSIENLHNANYFNTLFSNPLRDTRSCSKNYLNTMPERSRYNVNRFTQDL